MVSNSSNAPTKCDPITVPNLATRCRCSGALHRYTLVVRSFTAAFEQEHLAGLRVMIIGLYRHNYCAVVVLLRSGLRFRNDQPLIRSYDRKADEDRNLIEL